jgi:hypothetical protein
VLGVQAPLRVLACGDTGQTCAREITLAFDALEDITDFLADPILESLVPIVSRATSEPKTSLT